MDYRWLQTAEADGDSLAPTDGEIDPMYGCNYKYDD